MQGSGICSPGNSVQTKKGGMNFRKLDLVLDFLVDIRMKPYIELGYKPELFLYTPERCLREEDREEGIYPYDTFCGIIKALCMHLVNRYGADEVESWYFEFWNDPQLKMTEADGDYYHYFEAIYRTFKDILPEVRVGGAGFILGYETPIVKDISRSGRRGSFIRILCPSVPSSISLWWECRDAVREEVH